jgi:hypothetical protein
MRTVRMTTQIMAAILLAGLATPAMADFSAVREGNRVILQGNHFRITVDAARGGEMAEIRLFDGSLWNRLLGGDGQTCPQIKLSTEVDGYSLANDGGGRIEKVESTPDVLRVETIGNPRTADGLPSPWTVKLSYEVHPEGAVFVDVDYTLDEGDAVLTGSSMSLVVDRSVTKAAKYRCTYEDDAVRPKGRKFWSSYRPLPPEWEGWFNSMRIAFGVNPQRSFTNELQAVVEYRTAMGKTTTGITTDRGETTWSFVGRKVELRAPFHYHNRFSLALGSGVTGMGKPTTRLVAQRGYDWFRTKGDAAKLNARKTLADVDDYPPSNEFIDKMVANGATFINFQTWLRDGPFCGHPHARYVPVDEKELVRAVAHAHEKGLRVVFYTRGCDRYCLDQKFFEKYLKRNWDGIYVDWHGPYAMTYHETLYPAEPAMGDAHLSTEGNYVPVREWYRYSKRLRQVVGPSGLLMGHEGSYSWGIFAGLLFDCHYVGENYHQLKLFTSRDEAAFAGLMGGGLCTPYPRIAAFRTPEAIAKMAGWGLYPVISLGVIDTDNPKWITSGDPDNPANTYHLGYWRVLRTIDAERATVYNRPSVNQVAATCSQRDFSCVVYREKSNTGNAADDAYLVIVANLGPRTARSDIALVPSVLGMSGEYEVARVDPQTGSLSPQGTTTRQLTTTSLPTWGFEGYKLTRKH